MIFEENVSTRMEKHSWVAPGWKRSRRTLLALWSSTLEKNLGGCARTPDTRLKPTSGPKLVEAHPRGPASLPAMTSALRDYTGKDAGKASLPMSRKASPHPDLIPFPQFAHETLDVGTDVGKKAHVAGFVSSTLLTRHQRFEQCPALAFDNSREGFRSLIDRVRTYVPLSQVQVVVEVTGQYHRALLQSLQEQGIPVYVIHVQKRQEGLLKTDKRDALGASKHALQPA